MINANTIDRLREDAGSPRVVAELRERAGHLLVRRVLVRDDWISEAVLDIAAGSRTDWTPEQWHALLRDLRRTPGKLSDWLDLNC